MLKILRFIGGQQFFQVPPGIKPLHDQGRKHIHLLPGEAKHGTGEAISATLLVGGATGVHLTGALGKGVVSKTNLVRVKDNGTIKKA